MTKMIDNDVVQFTKGKEHYDEIFYQGMSSESLDSAKIYLTYLWNYIQPKSVLDVGCGRGAWLKACHDLGSVDLYGYDGDWNNQSQMIDQGIQFSSKDLNESFVINHKVDLLITLEVAEHLRTSSSTQFINSITDSSDAILFSAAYLGQGGTNHINEQRHSYWARLFSNHGFVAFDLFRPRFWGDKKVGFWYQQNTFLYLKKDSPTYENFVDSGFSELKNINLLDCVHPDLYDFKRGQGLGFKTVAKELIPSFLRALRRRIS